jgi:hypothetical protein
MTTDTQESQHAVVTRRERIRRLFLDRRESYGPDEVLAVTGITAERVRAAIYDGDIEGEVEGELLPGGFRIVWAQLATLALDVWGIDASDVEEALGADAARVLPPLVRTVSLTVRVPRYQVAVLGMLARQEGVPVDALVREALLALTEERADVLELPGLWEAVDFPVATGERETASGERVSASVPSADCGLRLV